MDKGSKRETKKDCTICGSTVKIVGNAATRCSNRRCITRKRDNNLGTDASASEVADYYQEQDTIERDEIDDAIEQAYLDFKGAGNSDRATAKNGAVKALLPFSSYSGFGGLRMDVDGV